MTPSDDTFSKSSLHSCEQIEQLNDHFRKAQAEFEATVKELNKQRTCCVTSQVGQSGSMLEQNLSQVSTQFKDIRSNVRLYAYLAACQSNVFH